MASELETGARRDGIAFQWFTAAWATALEALCLAKNRSWFQDDIYITLRYARHLADGLGPVWNRTGTPVEGFSSPLHLLLVSGLLMLHIDPVIAVRGLSFTFHGLVIAYVWSFVRRSSGAHAGVLAAALVAASWPMLVWDLGGLDAVPFSALLTIGVLATLRYVDSGARRDAIVGGLLLGLAIFMRPDGALVAAIAFAACLLSGPRTLSRRLADVLLAGGACVLIVLPWEFFRIAYFHAALPNTYYAKIYGISLAWRIHSGLFYWRIYVGQAPYFVPLLLVLVALLLFRRRALKFDLALWACIAGYALYLLDCGGDHMPGFRFMTPVIPLFAVALARALGQLGALQTPARAAAVSASLLLVTALQTRVPVLNPFSGDLTMMLGEEIGRHIDAQWKPGSVVALNAAGATPYFADRLTYIDMLGLNDAVISRRHPVPVNELSLVGHLKGDGDSVLARQPDYVILEGPLGALADHVGPHLLGDFELTRLPSFAQQYVACQSVLRVSDFKSPQLRALYATPTVTFTYYQRRDSVVPCSSSASPPS